MTMDMIREKFNIDDEIFLENFLKHMPKKTLTLDDKSTTLYQVTWKVESTLLVGSPVLTVANETTAFVNGPTQ